MMTNNPIPTEIISSDVVVLQSLDKYIASKGVTPNSVRPEQYLSFYQEARDVFYSDVAQRTSRLIAYINAVPADNDESKALKFALARHMRDKAFISILTEQLRRENNMYANALVGSFVCEALRMYYEDMQKLDTADEETAKANKKKDDKAQAPTKSHVDPETVESMMTLGKHLLADYCVFIQSKFVKLEESQVISVAALLAMGNEHTASALIDSDIPITADVLDCGNLINNDQLGRIYTGILRLKKEDWVKLSANQAKFVESLTKWIYNGLNSMDMALCLNLLVYAYGSMKPSEYVKGCLIQPKDCGSQYPNLRQVAMSLQLN